MECNLSIERALIARAQPHFLAARAQALIQYESLKGCNAEIAPFPVHLEPPFQRIEEFSSHPDPGKLYLPVLDSNTGGLRRVRVWISPQQKFDWVRSELFVKSLRNLGRRAGLEIVGSNQGIEFYFLVDIDDLPSLQSAFTTQYDQCELTVESSSPAILAAISDWKTLALLDFYPLPPYSHLFSQPLELKVSPLNTIIAALAAIEPPALGIYQLLFQGVPADHNWHNNVNALNDLEYTVKLMNGMPSQLRNPVQSPSGELRGMAMDAEQKAHNDKPFFAAAMRMGVVGSNCSLKDLQSMRILSNLFQHGGQCLSTVSEGEYQEVLSQDQIGRMFLFGETYRAGFILNSSELTGMVHLPPPNYLSNEKVPVVLLETLRARTEAALAGTPVGQCQYAGQEKTICIPQAIRSRSTHLIARQGMGKSTTLEHMVLSDIASGSGVAVLDPHGDLIRRLLELIPKNHAERCVLYAPADREWVPLWNPLKPSANQDLSRTADDLVSAIRHIVQGWGDRLENLLRHSFCSLLQIEGSTLLDVSNLLKKKSPESLRLIAEIERSCDSETIKNFWRHDFPRYSDQDLSPSQHKLSKLLMSGTVSLMLSQPENRFNFREIMDSGKILLADLSGLGHDLRGLLGSFVLSLLHIAAVSRSNILFRDRKPFHIYCDEAHLFLSASIADLIPETRKFAVDLTLAHQYLSQFDHISRDSILTTGSTIIFNVDLSDARYLAKDLRDRIKPEDIASFEVGEAVARIGTEIIRIKTPPPHILPATNARQYIIDESHRKYYKPLPEVRAVLTGRMGKKTGHSAIHPDQAGETDGWAKEEKFQYEEFE